MTVKELNELMVTLLNEGDMRFVNGATKDQINAFDVGTLLV